jgi:REP element-mobilizing transposase RayT
MTVTHRHLPHVYEIGYPLFLTFRLHGSLPAGRYFHGGQLTSGQIFVVMDKLLDHELCGPLYLRMPEIAELVAEQIQSGAVSDYDLHEWVIMPNHVHMLITPRIDVPMLLRTLKGRTAKAANDSLNRRGQSFWQHETYDRLVRHDSEFQKIATYIRQNPVKAMLCANPEDFQWSSAWFAV